MDDRSTGIGSSDVAAIVGISPYGTPFSVYAEKLGLAEKPESEAMRWGKKLQRGIAEEWAERQNVGIAWLDTTVRHQTIRYFMATPDAEVVPKDLGPAKEGLEIKMANWRQRDRWGEEGTDAIPAEYVIQGQWQCYVKRWERVYVAALFGGNELGSYVVEHDAKLTAFLATRCDQFWHDHVLAKVPPPLDWTDAAARVLKERFPQASGPQYRDSVVEDDALVIDLARLRRSKVAVTRAYDAAVNLVKERIGQDKGIRGPGYVVSWYNTKETRYEVKRPAGRGFRCRGEIFETGGEDE